MDYCTNLLTGFHISALAPFRRFSTLYPVSAFSNKSQFMSTICPNPLPPNSFPCYLEKNQSPHHVLQGLTGLGQLLCPHPPMPSHFLIPLQPHWSSRSSWNTSSQLPHTDTLHLLNSLPGMFFPQIQARLAFSPHSDLYSDATSLETSFLTTLCSTVQSLSLSLLCSVIIFSWLLSPFNILYVLLVYFLPDSTRI